MIKEALLDGIGLGWLSLVVGSLRAPLVLISFGRPITIKMISLQGETVRALYRLKRFMGLLGRSTGLPFLF